MKKIRKIIIVIAVLIVVVFSLIGGAISDRLFGYKILDRYFPRLSTGLNTITEQRVLNEESVVIEVVENVGPSVVTIVIEKEESALNPFNIEFGPFGFNFPDTNSLEPEIVEENIGSGFIISDGGMVVTNKHVVADTQAKYKIITKDDQSCQVDKIYRDPGNDLAILQIEGEDFKPVELGDSSNLKVGQFVIAIGTALGEFKDTVTTGVISGLGRGITAGSLFQSSTERLDDVIQTDAAINPGNSGGPLLNSGGQVIGVNVAVAAQGQNISFAIPINIIKEAIDNFNETGQFDRPFFGVRYRIINRDVALMNDVPPGAYIVEVIDDSSAQEADIQEGDIIIEFDGQSIKEDFDLATLINKKKIGDRIDLIIWRDGEQLNKQAILQGLSQ